MRRIFFDADADSGFVVNFSNGHVKKKWRKIIRGVDSHLDFVDVVATSFRNFEKNGRIKAELRRITPD